MSAASDLVRLALQSSLQAALVAAAVAGTWYALGRRAPGLRYALLGVLALKLAVPAGWTAPTSVWARADAPRVAAVTPSTPRSLGLEGTADSTPAAGALPSTPASPETELAPAGRIPSIAVLVLGVWAIGALLRLYALAREAFALARLRRGARPIDVGAPPRVLAATHAQLDLPIAFGVLRPTVLLPTSLAKDDATRRAVVAHELAHLRHRDPFAALVVAVLGAIWWFHPAAWWLQRAVRRTQEDLVDDAVVRGRPPIAPDAYCAALLETARRSAGVAVPSLTCGSGAMSSLERRFRRILEPKVPARRKTMILPLLLPLSLTFAVVPQSTDGAAASTETTASAPGEQEALERALAWLASRQLDGGSFSPSDPEGDALALLAFLGAGNTQKFGPYAEVVSRGVAHLSSAVVASAEGPSGLEAADPLNVLVLSEAATLDQAEVRGLATGVNALVRSLQTPDRVDPEVAFWSSLALASARDAGIELPAGILDATVSRVPWFAAAGGGNWTDAHHAAAATLLHALSGNDPKDGRVTAATQRILGAVERGEVDEQLLHLGSYALFQVGGKPWKTWRALTMDMLLAGQRKDGSWAQAKNGGSDVGTTALRLLSLEASWRYARITGGR
ncbi:MAG: M56 family metallopeptidase [Planctomycetota bacterium]